MKALVTGATGFIGSAVARNLCACGWSVRVLVRPNSDRAALAGLEVEFAVGDMTDPDSLHAATEGCDALFHVAADYRLWVPDPDVMHRVNVEGTRVLMQSALDHGIKRIVYTSSVATLDARSDGGVVDETALAPLEHMVGEYKRSKWRAERIVTDWITARQLPAVVVNPSAPVGPGDRKPTPTGRMVVDAARGRMPAYVDTGLNIVHVDDVAEGHRLAFEHGDIGERYILGSENLTLEEIIDEIAGYAEVRGTRFRLPHNAVLPMAYAAEAWARISGREPAFTVDGVRMSRNKMFFTSSKARGALGYAPRPAREALRNAVDWFRQHGYLQ